MTAAATDHSGLALPPRELFEFACRQVVTEQLYGDVEQRSKMRKLIVVPVLVQPVDDDLAPIGSPFYIVTRDLSPMGAGFVHFDAIGHKKLALQICLAMTTVNLLARVVWCTPVGPFFGSGVTFIHELNKH